MKKALLLATASSLVILATGCSNTTQEAKVAKVEVKKIEKVAVKKSAAQVKAEVAFKNATTANKMAKEAGFDWNVTYPLLKDATQALKDGDYEVSARLSNQAKSYALKGIGQAATAATAGPHSLLK
jgi:hypothetical protein